MSGSKSVSNEVPTRYRSFIRNHQFPGQSTSSSRTIEDEINYLLKFYSFDDAVFLAEMYHESEQTENTLYIYADCLVRSNKKEEVYVLLNGNALANPKLRYLYAKCCFDLNKVEDCQVVLLNDETASLREDLKTDPEIAPLAHALYSAVLCDEAHTEEAIEECRKALILNIMAWSAVCSYIKYGGDRLEEILTHHRKRVHELQIEFSPFVKGTRSEMHRKRDAMRRKSLSRDAMLKTEQKDAKDIELDQQVSTNLNSKRTSSTATTTTSSSTGEPQAKEFKSSMPAAAPVSRSAQPSAPRKSSRLSELATRRSLFDAEPPHSTRATNSSRNRMNVALSSDTENVHSVSAKTRTTPTPTSRGGSVTKTPSKRTPAKNSNAGKTKSPSQRRRETIKQPLVSRNSNLVRSLSGSTNSISSANEERPMEVDQVDAPTSSNLTTENNMSSKEHFEKRKARREMTYKPAYDKKFMSMFDLYAEIALIEEAVGKYNWSRSTKLFNQLSPKVKNDLSVCKLLMGRACFEQAEYGECRHTLDELHKKRPWIVEGTELLSTSLWHLQDTHALSVLAQNLTMHSRERSQTWCAAGNCFSLQRQHNQAVECLERAIQLDRRFAYAHTLLGHELIVQDELNRAAGAFRKALLLSPRDYRAWYGLGLVHLKREQNSLAQANIQKAIEINPTNRAMLCTLSQVEQQRGRTEKAIQLIDRALKLNPLDVACRFNRAKLLFEAKRNEECLEELSKLKASSPDEAFVFHLLARVHRRMGSTHMALLNYSWAAELDPRGDQNAGETSMASQSREEYEEDEYGSPV